MTRTFKTIAKPGPDLLAKRLRATAQRLKVQREAELSANQSNFDSGLPLEDFFRHELSQLISPYVASPGHVVDSAGYTCGECDVVLSDPRIAPLLHPQAAPDSRRRHFAFESTYGIVEVKQRLTMGALSSVGTLRDHPGGTLWEACTKVFAYKQLQRAQPSPIRWGATEPIGIVFFYDTREPYETREERDRLLMEFQAINATVSPEVRVDGVYVLDAFTLGWAFLSDPETRTFLTLQHASEAPQPLWTAFSATGETTISRLFVHLWSLLVRTQLAAPDLLNSYGGERFTRGSVMRCIRADQAVTDEQAT